MELNHRQRQEIIDFTVELVSHPGGSGDEGITAACVQRKMRQLGYDEVRVDSYGSVIGVLRATGSGPTLLFDGHMDVVPVREPESWHHAPYGGEISDGKIWGRGSCDMKAALAAMICAPSYVDRSALNADVIVSASVAEELLIGSALDRILEAYPVDAVVIGEPTGMQLGRAEKGRASVIVTSHGTVAHSSRPDLGDNAIYRMTEAIGRIRSMPRRSDAFLGDEVIELVEISSLPSPGNGSIPGECQSLWECRILDGESRQQFIERWNSALAGISRLDVKTGTYELNTYTDETLTLDDYLPGWVAHADNLWIQRVEGALGQCGLPVQYYPVPYGCNALISAGKWTLPTVIIGPGDIALAHKPNEHVSIHKLIDAARVYATLCQNFPCT